MTDPNYSDIPAEELHKALFTQLVAMLATSALQSMGKLVNPMTKKAEVNTEAAQVTIDTIAALEAKSKGNLDKDEARFLSETLSSLRMNFWEMMQSGAAPQPEPAQPAQPEPAADAKPKDDDGPKFHKSYS